MVRRPATTADYEDVFAVHREALREYIERIWGHWDEAWQRENCRRECSESTCELLMVAETMVGFVQYVDEHDHLRVWNVALRPESRERGLGTLLIKQLQEQARSRGVELRLRIFPTNERAYKFYMKLGFREVSRAPTGIELAWRHAAA